jgi:NAD(P)H dehydrogenase (quinone)
MRHALILAHPRRASFTGAVMQAYREAVKALGHDTIIRDLYAMDFDPCLKAAEIPGAPDYAVGADVLAEREQIGGCDVFALFYPLWLNAPPAMLKGYLDRVFGFGFAYGGEGHSFNPLLTGRRLISFTASGAPNAWVEKTGALEAVHILFDRYLAQLCGLTLLDHVHFGAITPGASQVFIRARLDDVGQTVRQHFATIPQTGAAS